MRLVEFEHRQVIPQGQVALASTGLMSKEAMIGAVVARKMELPLATNLREVRCQAGLSQLFLP